MNSVFITGGTSGIGLELAKVYARRGWHVGVCGRDKQKYEQEIKPQFKEIQFYCVDVSDRQGLKSAIHDFSGRTGLALLIASAGISYPNKTKLPDFDRTCQMVQVNLLGVIHAFEGALEVMVPQGQGQLVAISSIAGFNGFPGTSGYSATKSGVMKFCESLSMDLKPMGISVSCVCPGFVDTPLTQLNHHPMPFLIPAHKAAEIILKKLEKKRQLIIFPFWIGLFVRVLSVLPRWLYRFIMSTPAINYSRSNDQESSP